MRRLLYFSIFIFSYIFTNCADHPIEKPNKLKNISTIPDFTKVQLHTILDNTNYLDGHYNVKITNTEILVKNEFSEFASYSPYEVVYKSVDFRSFGNKNGTLMFGYDGIFCWIDPPIKIDEKGKFNATVGPRAQWLFINYIGCKLEIRNGELSNNKLEAEVIETYYAGMDPEKIEAIAVYKYTLGGYKRYRPKTIPAKKVEGEYKSITTKFSNTCEFQTLPSGNYYFSVNIIPQNNNHYYIDIENLLSITEMPIDTEGYLDSTLKSTNNIYLIKGKITPEKIELNINITYNFDDGYTCSQKYEMHGIKRFEEADNRDTTIDGIYSILMPVESITCQGQPSMAEQYLDSLKIDDNTAIISIGSRKFIAKLDANKKFTATISNGAYYKITHTLKNVMITPNNISGKLITEYTMPPNGTCNILYNLSGKKLYKHN